MEIFMDTSKHVESLIQCGLLYGAFWHILTYFYPQSWPCSCILNDQSHCHAARLSRALLAFVFANHYNNLAHFSRTIPNHLNGVWRIFRCHVYSRLWDITVHEVRKPLGCILNHHQDNIFYYNHDAVGVEVQSLDHCTLSWQLETLNVWMMHAIYHKIFKGAYPGKCTKHKHKQKQWKRCSPLCQTYKPTIISN